jgi:hypothetical protein
MTPIYILPPSRDGYIHSESLEKRKEKRKKHMLAGTLPTRYEL